MITVNKQTKVYVACPPNISTGGTELLHQLVVKLSKIDIEAYIFYYPVIKDCNPVHPNFVKYNTRYVTEIEDIKENLLIVAEIFSTRFNNYTQIRKCLWWLSVDNFFVNAYSRSYWLRLFSLLHLENYYKSFVLKRRTKSFSYHIAQSYYAINFLKSNKVHCEYLSDYLNDSFLNTYGNNNGLEKKSQVIYNPKKGIKFTKRIIAATKDKIKWIPIINMKPHEVSALLGESKLYIDFGHHPGKDRIPREAAISGCCILTGRKGAAANDYDIPLLNKYKIEDKKSNLPSVINMIFYTLDNYEKCRKDFEKYIEKIKEEEKTFESDLKKIFDRN